MKIRWIDKADVEMLFHIRYSVKENLMTPEQLSKLGYTPDSIRKDLLSRHIGWIVAIDDSDIGFCLFDKLESKIIGLFILPEFQGRGIGKMLLAKAENFLKNLGFSKAYLDTSNNKDTRAYKLYHKCCWRLYRKLVNNRIRLEKNL